MAGWHRRSWVLVDPATGNVQGVVPAGEFSRRFRLVDVFADVPGLPAYLGTLIASDGTALVDLVLDRNPFMLANGSRRAARPHALVVPRRHRDGWSCATASELAACRTAMALVAAWARSLDGGHVVFCANDSPPNLGYLRDVEAATGSWPAAAPMWRSPIPGRTCSTPTCTPSMPNTAGPRTASRRRLRGIPSWPRVTGRGVPPSAATPCRWNGTAPGSPPGMRAAAQLWGGSYCSYQLGVDGPLWVMPALGPSQDEVNRRLARADGLPAEPDPTLGGAVNLVRPTLADAGRLHAAQRATAEQRASFETFAAQRRLTARSLAVGLPEHRALCRAWPLAGGRRAGDASR